jgi:hypothetical protein
MSSACKQETKSKADRAGSKTWTRATVLTLRIGNSDEQGAHRKQLAQDKSGTALARWTWLGDNETSGPRRPSMRPRRTPESRNKHTSGKSTKISQKAGPDRSSPHMSGLDRIRPAAEHRAVLIKGLTLEPESGRAQKPEAKNFQQESQSRRPGCWKNERTPRTEPDCCYSISRPQRYFLIYFPSLANNGTSVNFFY